MRCHGARRKRVNVRRMVDSNLRHGDTGLGALGATVFINQRFLSLREAVQ